MRSIQVLVIFLLCAMDLSAQVTNRENYDIRSPKDLNTACERLNGVLKQLPPELRLSATIRNDTVYMSFPDREWFSAIIDSKGDGIAIDLVQKEQFQCDNISRFAGSWSHKGYLLPPLYRDELTKRLRNGPNGYIFFAAGVLPRNLKQENVEPNYILLEDRNFCTYTAIVNVDFHGWKLLRTGLYYDTLTREKLEDKFRELSKTLHFTIPFEKNKSSYHADDLKPLYDSLRLTDYAIKTISIKAFTSVEGAAERNEELQAERLQSLVGALQTFQSEKIASTLSSSENWVEFLNDVGKTNPELLPLTKEEIKARLKSPALLSRLEPMLQKHRKGIVDIHLEKRLSYRESNPDELRKYFNQTIAAKNIDEALYLQQIIFHKIGRHEFPDQYVRGLEIPEAIEFGSLLINREAFYFDQSYTTVFEAIEAFDKLNQLLPGNPHVLYNRCALHLKAWSVSDILTTPETLMKEMDALLKKGIHPELVKRLRLNYHIILAEKYERLRQFSEKEKVLRFVLNAYKELPLTDADLVNLSKYFSHYSKFDWSEKVIEPRIKSIDVAEDLVFYYLNLTIFDSRYTKSAGYRTTMLNAVNSNRQRFCKLFDTSGEGGISFQLLTDPYLKKTYCENCR